MFIVCGLSRDACRQRRKVSIHKTRAVKSSAIEKLHCTLTGCETVRHFAL